MSGGAGFIQRAEKLLRELRPRVNRAGTWPGVRRFVAWQATGEGLALALTVAVEPGWQFHGPLGSGAISLRATLARLCWCAIHPQRGLAGMPDGWFRGRFGQVATIPRREAAPSDLEESAIRLQALFGGDPDQFTAWVRERTAAQDHPFEVASREADLEALSEFAKRAAEKLVER